MQDLGERHKKIYQESQPSLDEVNQTLASVATGKNPPLRSEFVVVHFEKQVQVLEVA